MSPESASSGSQSPAAKVARTGHRAEDRVIRGVLMDRLTRHNQAPGLCVEHGGLMWSNAMRACITPDDVIRGGCIWEPLRAIDIGATDGR